VPSSPQADPRTDEALIDAINEGDAAAFETLYYRYRDYVVRLAWRFTGSQDDALDVLQETFSYLLGKFPGFRLSASMTTFLYPAIKHLSLALRKKRQRYVSNDEAVGEVITASTTSDNAGRDELAAVMSALAEPQREVVLMRFVDGMTLAEIAHALDVPIGSIKSRLHRALAALREDNRTRRYFEA